MKAGLLRHLVEIQSLSNGVDEIGQPINEWATTATVHANIRYQSGISSIKSGADVSISRASIRMRHRAVSAGQRIVYGDEVFEIDAVLPDGRREYVDCVVKVINADT